MNMNASFFTAEIAAKPQWQLVDFISDIHLRSNDPTTYAAWCDFLKKSKADAVVLLGDIFEVWVGDDLVSFEGEEGAFAKDCLAALSERAKQTPVYVMHGNRDFLMRACFARDAQVQMLHDPCVLVTHAGRFLLSHGDDLCVDDKAYMAFRAQARNPLWQEAVLAKPLAERMAQALKMREASREQQSNSLQYAEVDADMALSWLQEKNCSTLIHGHTHRPNVHELAQGARRYVLSDWDFEQNPPRADVLRLNCQTGEMVRLSPHQA